MSALRSLWSDERGFVVSSELVLIATLVVIGMVVGLQTVREAVVEELADVANAVGNVNQSYSYAGVTGHHSSTAGSFLVDAIDDCDTPVQGLSIPAQCVTVCTVAATHEI